MLSQLIYFLDRNNFKYLARKYGGDKYIKQFTCYNQLCVLMFGQRSNRASLRDVVRTTQADANTKRDYQIIKEFAYKVIIEAQQCRIVDIFKLNGNVYTFDSTTVDLCLSTFVWAQFRKRKGGIKMHTLYDVETQTTFFHITLAKVHTTKAIYVILYKENSFYIFDRGYNDFKSMKWKHRFPPGSGILSDAVGYIASQLTREKYPEKISRVIYWDKENRGSSYFIHKCADYQPSNG